MNYTRDNLNRKIEIQLLNSDDLSGDVYLKDIYAKSNEHGNSFLKYSYNNWEREKFAEKFDSLKNFLQDFSEKYNGHFLEENFPSLDKMKDILKINAFNIQDFQFVLTNESHSVSVSLDIYPNDYLRDMLIASKNGDAESKLKCAIEYENSYDKVYIQASKALNVLEFVTVNDLEKNDYKTYHRKTIFENKNKKESPIPYTEIDERKMYKNFKYDKNYKFLSFGLEEKLQGYKQTMHELELDNYYYQLNDNNTIDIYRIYDSKRIVELTDVDELKKRKIINDIGNVDPVKLYTFLKESQDIEPDTTLYDEKEAEIFMSEIPITEYTYTNFLQDYERLQEDLHGESFLSPS